MSKLTIRQFIQNYESGKYANSELNTMIAAGWHDWFCEDTELKQKLDAMFPLLKQIVYSQKINIDTMYVFFKNNCPGTGDLYDDFRISEISNDDVVYTITPSCGHERTKGQASIWGRENGFEKPIITGTWEDVSNYFAPDVITFEAAVQKRNEARKKHSQFKVNDETPKALLNAEYDWGYWDAVVTIMKNQGLREINKKAVL